MVQVSHELSEGCLSRFESAESPHGERASMPEIATKGYETRGERSVAALASKSQ
jgi:hypothetical protein